MEGICKVCGSKGKVVRHHISYEKDITVLLCYKCHKKAHKNGIPLYRPVDKKPESGHRIKIDVDAHRILKKYREFLGNQGVEGADFSDAIREMDRGIKEQVESVTALNL